MSSEPQGVSILGSTGSIGTQTLDVIAHLAPAFDVVALAASSNTALLSEQASRFNPQLVVCAMGNGESLSLPEDCLALEGAEGLLAAATHPDVDILVVATAGHSAIEPTIEAIKLGKTIALANKEALVCAADLILPLARQHGVTIHPIDSEHSAIWQSLDNGHSAVQRLILTASGGPFLDWPLDRIPSASVEDALGHPTWSMGAKITIDSATMMNKGLEVIEAHSLFGVPYEQIDVLIHPESIIHSMVAFADGSQIAQLSWPDMRLPIQYALTYPHHIASPCRQLDLAEAGALTFRAVEPERFPALDLARQCGIGGQTYPTVLSAADEVAVAAFLAERIGFGDIVPVVRSVIDAHQAIDINELGDVLAADAWSRELAEQLIARHDR
ncbi:MAG: 1-deoxy-D-xylulose-5-phosphate reductoisomerase [Thermomicrobiales bacterium]|nr:1-deoxy-D-xylulose-5-phosphate reductoisomerase [Thermomicrobiales bacterium]